MVAHVPKCILGSFNRGFVDINGGGNFPGIPGTCATRNVSYLVKSHKEWVMFIFQVFLVISDSISLYGYDDVIQNGRRDPSFEDRLKQLRQEDLSVLRKGAIANAINLGTSFSSPFLVNTITWQLLNITCTNVDLTSNVLCGICLRPISKEVPMNLTCNMYSLGDYTFRCTAISASGYFY